jgi:hypothetical protein
MQQIAELGFGQAVFTNRSITLDVPESFVATVDDLAGRHGITPEKFMDAILNEGSFEAHLELRAQMNEAAGAKKQNCRRGNRDKLNDKRGRRALLEGLSGMDHGLAKHAPGNHLALARVNRPIRRK